MSPLFIKLEGAVFPPKLRKFTAEPNLFVDFISPSFINFKGFYKE